MSEYIVDLAEYRGNAETIKGVKEEIVRCEDCKYGKHYNDKTAYKDWCLGVDGDVCIRVTPNGFCAWGERRDND